MMTEGSWTVLPDSSQRVCSSQDNSCSQQSMNSAQQSSCDSEVTSNKQGTSSEADTSTSQGTSCLRQSDFPEVIDLSSTQYSTPTTPPDSVQLSGLQIYKEDVQTVQPKSMITDTIVLFLFK